MINYVSYFFQAFDWFKTFTKNKTKNKKSFSKELNSLKCAVIDVIFKYRKCYLNVIYCDGKQNYLYTEAANAFDELSIKFSQFANTKWRFNMLRSRKKKLIIVSNKLSNISKSMTCKKDFIYTYIDKNFTSEEDILKILNIEI